MMTHDDSPADPFRATIGFGPQCKCGAATEKLPGGYLVCQRCDNRTGAYISE